MIDKDEHANITNPCQGICVSNEHGTCIGCQRTEEERNNWYLESNEWRENVLKELPSREEQMFGGK
jgi:predicted Fe-S protein YdhL (DUF1289 family)